MHFHPVDTTRIYNKMNTSEIDQLWYRIHYFQQKSLEQGDNRLEKLHKDLQLNKMARTFIDKRLKQRKVFLLSGLQRTHDFKIISGTPNAKLLPGMGGAHVRESSITLHPLYGVPYIPASSIKGAVRNWAIQAFFNGKETDLKEEKNTNQQQSQINKVFIDIFGNEEKGGQIEFFDAFVDSGFTLQPDVLTVHFPQYYKRNSFPGDNQSPIPINFYVIDCKSVQFITGISRDARLGSGYTTAELLELASTWLQKTLIELGIGSKSSAGYGYFTAFTDLTEQTMQEVRKAISTQSEAKMFSLKAGHKEVENEPVVQEKMPSNLSPAQKLVYEIQHFSEKDLERSKTPLIFDQVVALAEQGEKEPARALKEFWERNGAWKADSKKQKLKVAHIKNLLGDK
jgi:CRISPR-associated protein Cmr6